MINLQDVTAWYGDVIALNGVTAKLETPIVGLLGPNGAGKSTLLSILAGLRRANTGTAHVLGETPFDNPKVLARIGLVPEPLAPPSWITGHRFVTHLARLNGLARSEAADRATKTLAWLGLQDAMHRPINTYSQGMRQRAKLAQALVHEPAVLLLDEPFTGLDAPGRQHMTRVIQEIAQRGTQVVFSSHILTEVEAVTRDVLMLLHGRTVAHGSVREVRARLSDVPLRVGVNTPEPRRVAAALLELPGVHGVTVQANSVVASVTHGTTFFRHLTEAGATLPIHGFSPLDEDLESVYALLAKKGGGE